MIYHRPERGAGAGAGTVSREMAIGLVVLSLVAAGLLRLGFCRSGIPGCPVDEPALVGTEAGGTAVTTESATAGDVPGETPTPDGSWPPPPVLPSATPTPTATPTPRSPTPRRTTAPTATPRSARNASATPTATAAGPTGTPTPLTVPGTNQPTATPTSESGDGGGYPGVTPTATAGTGASYP